MSLTRRLRDVRTIKRLLTAAEAEGRAAGEDRAGAEHLLLAALALPDGLARRALTAAGGDPDGLRAAIEAVHDDALRSVGVAPVAVGPPPADPPAGPLRTGPTAQAAFRRAGELARGDGDRRLGLTSAHVALAVAEIERGAAPRALRRIGVEAADLRRAAAAELAAARTAAA